MASHICKCTVRMVVIYGNWKGKCALNDTSCPSPWFEKHAIFHYSTCSQIRERGQLTAQLCISLHKHLNREQPNRDTKLFRYDNGSNSFYLHYTLSYSLMMKRVEYNPNNNLMSSSASAWWYSCVWSLRNIDNVAPLKAFVQWNTPLQHSTYCLLLFFVLDWLCCIGFVFFFITVLFE